MKTLFLIIIISLINVSLLLASTATNPGFLSKSIGFHQNYDTPTPQEPGSNDLNFANVAIIIGVVAAAILLSAAIGMQGYFMGYIAATLVFLVGTILGLVKAKKAMRKSEKGTKIWKKGLIVKKIAIFTLILGFGGSD
jgi:hypothetical protein